MDTIKNAVEFILNDLAKRHAKGEKITRQSIPQTYYPGQLGVHGHRDQWRIFCEVREQWFAEWYDKDGKRVKTEAEAVYTITPCYESSINQSPVKTSDGYWLRGPKNIVRTSQRKGVWNGAKKDAHKEITRHRENAAAHPERIIDYQADYLEALIGVYGYSPNIAQALELQAKRKEAEEAAEAVEEKRRQLKKVETEAKNTVISASVKYAGAVHHDQPSRGTKLKALLEAVAELSATRARLAVLPKPTE